MEVVHVWFALEECGSYVMRGEIIVASALPATAVASIDAIASGVSVAGPTRCNNKTLTFIPFLDRQC